MARKKRRRFEMDSIDEINMTPLIDLTFLLLIVFMITMPLVEYSLPVETPQMNAAPMPEKNSKTVFCEVGKAIGKMQSGIIITKKGNRRGKTMGIDRALYPCFESAFGSHK